VLTPGLLGTGFVPGLPGPKPETQLSIAVSRPVLTVRQLAACETAGRLGRQDRHRHRSHDGRLFYYGLTTNPAPQGGDVPLTEQVPASTRTWCRRATRRHVALGEHSGLHEFRKPALHIRAIASGVAAAVPGEDVSYWCGTSSNLPTSRAVLPQSRWWRELATDLDPLHTSACRNTRNAAAAPRISRRATATIRKVPRMARYGFSPAGGKRFSRAAMTRA